MATSKSTANVLLDSTLQETLNSSSPLRRKHTQKMFPFNLSENNDEEERLARRHEIEVATLPSVNVHMHEKRRSLGLGFLAKMPIPEISERIAECIKLNAENKINMRNAFRLEIIDFMTFMIKKQDTNMSSLQVASTSLDVSTKIYGFRVDGIHNEILKMTGGIDKQEKGEHGAIDGSMMEVQQVGEENQLDSQRKKKRKRNRQTIFSSVNALRGNVEIMKPSLMMMGEDDSQTTDMLCQVKLPNHADSGYYLHQYNDVIVDKLEPKVAQDSTTLVTTLRMEDFSDLEICKPLADFGFHDWTENAESEDIQPEKTNEGKFQFDLDASLPSDGEAGAFEINCLEPDSQNDHINTCNKSFNEVQNIVDFRKAITTATVAKASEYSFIQKNVNVHWAGPSHWKSVNFKKLGTSKVVETCHQGAAKKKKEVVLCYDDDAKKVVLSKFLPSQFIKLQAKSAKTDWNEAEVTLPRDMHYSIMQASKLYLYGAITVNVGSNHALNTTHLSDVIEHYNYNNENDTSNYCPDVINTDYAAEEDCNENDGIMGFADDNELGLQADFVGDNLVTAPKLTNKVSITYSLKAKKIDMRQLKKSIWKSLISTNDNKNMNIKEAVEQEAINEMKDNKRFSEVYKALPSMLTKTNADALSFPISFVSLLHLANDKVLKINSLPDMSDIIVEAN